MNIKPLPYPISKKGDVTTTYFGIEVPDPYRWLEDDEAADSKAWVIEQNKVTQNYLDQIPYRENIRQRLENMELRKIQRPI